MKRSTTTIAILAGAFVCIALTACDDSTKGSASAIADILDQNAASNSGKAPVGSNPSQAPSTTKKGPGTGGGNSDGTGGGNQDGTGGGNSGDNSDNSSDGSGDNSGDGSDNSSDSSGDGSGDNGGPTASPDDGIPSIDYAEVTCMQEADGSWMPYLSFAVSDTTGLDVNLNSEGTPDEGGYHNYETSYDGPTGTVPMPYTGCYSEYGEHIYRLSVQGHYDDSDLTEDQLELGEKTISMTGTYHDENAPSPKPRIDEYVLNCTYNADSGQYDMTLYYSVANADGMALSIDNPGVVGSFGEYGPSGTIDIPNLGCYAENGEQTYDLYTLGGVGDQAVVNLTRTGEYSYNDDGSGDAADDSSADATGDAADDSSADSADDSSADGSDDSSADGSTDDSTDSADDSSADSAADAG